MLLPVILVSFSGLNWHHDFPQFLRKIVQAFCCAWHEEELLLVSAKLYTGGAVIGCCCVNWAQRCLYICTEAFHGLAWSRLGSEVSDSVCLILRENP